MDGLVGGTEASKASRPGSRSDESSASRCPSSPCLSLRASRVARMPSPLGNKDQGKPRNAPGAGVLVLKRLLATTTKNFFNRFQMKGEGERARNVSDERQSWIGCPLYIPPWGWSLQPGGRTARCDRWLMGPPSPLGHAASVSEVSAAAVCARLLEASDHVGTV